MLKLSHFYSIIELKLRDTKTKSKGEVNMEKVKEYKITVNQFLTKPSDRYPDRKPVPMRTMFGYMLKETERGVYVVMKAKPMPTTTCLVCNRKLTHPVSLLYGIGPECGKHYWRNPGTDEDLEQYIEELRKRLDDIVWEGWLPKNYIKMEATGNEIEKFVTTSTQEESTENEVEQNEAENEEEEEEEEVDEELVQALVDEISCLLIE